MNHGDPRGRLLGRRGECEALDQLLARLRTGRSPVLVLRGEAGVGKSALLEYLVDEASGCRIIRAAGAEAEMELAYAGLQQLCAPLLEHLDALPAPQREALSTAFGLSAGDPPDRFFVGLAVLSLCAEAAGERPLLCVVDDAQWLDRASAQALAFVARRLDAESVAFVFAIREVGDESELPGLPDITVRGLTDADARALLESATHVQLDERVRNRIVAETRGNPLALLELPRAMTPAELAGGYAVPEAMPMASRIEQGFQRRLESLPPETRRLLLTAAAEPVGDATLVWRAAERLGIGFEAAAAAAEAELLEIDGRVRFRHPLVRSAAYRASAPPERQEVHQALADATDPERDPDRRAWHRAHATDRPDEDVASELERSASRAAARGGIAATAAFLERAAELTPDPAARGARALAAAQAKFESAAPDAALELLALAQLCPLEELDRVRLERLRAEIVFARTRGRDAPALLLDAARRLDPLDAAMARETHLEAMAAAMYAGRLGDGPDVREAAAAALAGPPAPDPPRPIDLLLDGLATRFTEGYAAAVPPVRKALAAFRDVNGSTARDQRWFWLACRLAQDLWDDELWYVLATRGVRVARETGMLRVLPNAITHRAALYVHAGAFGAASSLIEEADAITRATETAPLKYASFTLAAWRGHEAETVGMIEAGRIEAMARGEGLGLSVSDWILALLFNGLGRYQDALAAAQRSAADDVVANSAWALSELIEAGVRSGATDAAPAALDRLSERTQASGTDWALGILARSRALLSEGDAAEELYREALERLERTRIRVELARARLLYGEWLRREQRRVDAREQLRLAHEMFNAMGADGFSERARIELLATGETVRKRTVETRDELTAQEAQIARLARDGRTNPEIGAQLYISPRTVEWHLKNVFTKLGIRSRRELGHRLEGDALGGMSQGDIPPGSQQRSLG
jgi:DNA-binding CsgD family transcriptional regulator